MHVVKMILEIAQLLCTAHHVLGSSGLSICPKVHKKTHMNHPSAIWVRSGLFQYTWTAHLGIWLCLEYTFRYGKVHASQLTLVWLATYAPDTIPQIPWTNPPQCMPDQYKNSDSVEAYRKYYKGDKAYTKRTQPEWISG